jgi:peptide/nickel transport system substrate-binding protein
MSARLIAIIVVSLLALSAGCRAGPKEPNHSQIVVGFPRDSGPLNVFVGANDVLLGLVYDKLFEPSPYVDVPQPGLAERATQIDPLTWEVELKEGIRWNDGNPFTAEDVVFTFEYYRDGPPSRYSHHVSQVPRIERIEAVDGRRVRFTCGYPCPMLARVTLADLPILPQHVWKDVTEPRAVEWLPVGTGPYRATAYRADEYYRFSANQHYHRGRPRFERLVVPIVSDPSSMFLSLEAGHLHAAARPVPPELLPRLMNSSSVRVVRTTSLSIVELRPNYRRPPLDIPEFRRALSLAIDREALVDKVLLGQGKPGSKGYPHPDSPWTNPSLETPFNRAQAVALLDGLGLVDNDGDGVREDRAGRKLQFKLLVSGTEPTWIRSAELVARDLAAIGVRAIVETMEAGVVSKRFAARDYDMFISEIGPHGVADPDQFIMSHRSGYLWSSDMAYPALDELLFGWRSAETIEERVELSFRMQALFNQQPTSIALFYPVNHWAFRPAAFDGWRDSPGYGIFHKWSLLPAPSVPGEIIERPR